MSVQKKQRRHYSGKKKQHTIKTQVVVDKATKQIICVFCAPGKVHDKRVFEKSRVRPHPLSLLLVDTGYIGVAKSHKFTMIPIRGSKYYKVTGADKEYNRKVASLRVGSEHAIGFLKRFSVLSQRYRNRRKRFALRFNLIAGICNFEKVC